MQQKKYEIIDHTADVGMRVFGRTREELFLNAAYGLFDLIAGSSAVQQRVRRSFSLERETLDELLVEWLNALLYVFDTEQLLFCNFSVQHLTATTLSATATGERYDSSRHDIAAAVKAATYHNLQISEGRLGWEATVILDV